jgi:hypothetical protein
MDGAGVELVPPHHHPPVRDCAEVHLEGLPVGGISLPSAPVIVPVKRAIEHVQSSPANRVLCGRLPTRLSGKVLNSSTLSER